MSIWKIFLLVNLITLSGCSKLQQLQNLDASLTSISPITPLSLTPSFNIQLLVSNPNAQDLDIQGVSFSLNIAGNKIFSGLSNQIPTLKAYAQTPINLPASIDLYSLYKLLSYLNQHRDQEIKYELNTTIDPKGFIAFNLNKIGILDENTLQAFMTNL